MSDKPQIKLAETVVLIDAAFLNFVITDIKGYFEETLHRSLQEIDLSMLTTYITLDAGITEGKNEVQFLFVYDKESSRLQYCQPSDLQEELNGVAFQSPYGSQELFVSQPAITKHIQELETYYQARLFDRQGSKISLTKAGELLLKHSEKILDDYKQLEYEMHLLHNEYIGELKLGASTTIAQYVLPPLLANFIAKFPQINLSLINGNSRGVEAALQEHRIDLGLVEGIFRLPNLKYTPFLQDELVAVVHTQSKLAVSDEITPEDLLNIPLVLRERGSGTLDVFERALLQHNLKLSSLNVLMYLGSTESIKLFLEHTDCMGIVSIRSVHKELVAGNLRVVEIKGMPMLREFNFVQLQGQEGGLSQVFMRFAGHHSKSL